MEHPALQSIARFKWVGTGALLFAVGLPAAIETGIMRISDLIQQPENFVVFFSPLGALLGIWIVAAYHSPHSARHRLIARACGVLSAACAALTVLQISTLTHNATGLGTELIMAAALGISGAFFGGFLGKYLQKRLELQ